MHHNNPAGVVNVFITFFNRRHSAVEILKKKKDEKKKRQTEKIEKGNKMEGKEMNEVFETGRKNESAE